MSARKLKASEKLSLTSRYELLLCLASGGMGTVYLGVRRGTADIVAIKRAHAHLLEDPQFRKMFVAEAQLASRINHPNAIGVSGVDESDGELLMVMRYLRGGSLSDLLGANAAADSRLPPSVAIRIVLDAARGLHGAHTICDAQGRGLGIVHRDVSPQNILVGVDGTTAIVDFGVAKAAMSETTRSASDILKGKLAYMAPEYLSHRAASPQSDVFSLGVVAWEALANERLFKGDDEVETMLRILDPVPAPFLSERVSLDPDVSAIIARAVAKDPAKRFASAAEFADALEQKANAVELNASRPEVGAVASRLLGSELSQRDQLLGAILRPGDGAGPAFATGSMPQQRPMASSAAAPGLGTLAPPLLYPPQRVSPTLNGAPKSHSTLLLMAGAVAIQLAIVAGPLLQGHGGYWPLPGATAVAERKAKSPRSSQPTPKADVIVQRLERAGFTIAAVTRFNRSKPNVILKRADQPADTESIMVTRGMCSGFIYRYAPADEALIAWALSVEAYEAKAFEDGVVASTFTWVGDEESDTCTNQALLDIATGK